MPPIISTEQYWAQRRGEEIEPEDWQLAAQAKVAEALEQREQQVADDIEEHGEVAKEWYRWQGHSDLVAKVAPTVRRTKGATRIATSSRPQGRPRGRSFLAEHTGQPRRRPLRT